MSVMLISCLQELKVWCHTQAHTYVPSLFLTSSFSFSLVTMVTPMLFCLYFVSWSSQFLLLHATSNIFALQLLVAEHKKFLITFGNFCAYFQGTTTIACHQVAVAHTYTATLLWRELLSRSILKASRRHLTSFCNKPSLLH